MLIIWWSSRMTKQVKSLNNIIFLCKCLINLQGDRPSYIWTFKQFTTPPVPCAAVVVFVLPCHLPLLQDSPCFRLSWPNRGEGDHPKAQRREFLPCPLCPPCPAVGSCGNFCASFGTTLTTMRKFFGNHSPKTSSWNSWKTASQGAISVVSHHIFYVPYGFVPVPLKQLGVPWSLAFCSSAKLSAGGPNIKPFSK